MSDGSAAPSAAPAAGGAPSAANTNTESHAESKPSDSPQTRQGGGGPQKGIVAAPEGSTWNDEKKRQFFELAKESPYRAKFKGQEKAIDSEESMREILNHAQRGIGGTKLAEEKNRLEAELNEHRTKLERHQSLLERARQGDFEARKELGFVSPQELRTRQQEWEEVPEPVRQLAEERDRLAKEAAELKQWRESKEQEETQKREAAALSQAKRMAMTETHRVLQAIGMTEKTSERLLPFVAGAIADLRDHGLELGVDMPAELIVSRFKEMVGEFDEAMFDGLAPERSVPMLEKKLEAMDDAGILKTLSPKLANRIARAVAKAQTARRNGGGADGLPGVIPANSNTEERQTPPLVMPITRWRR